MTDGILTHELIGEMERRLLALDRIAVRELLSQAAPSLSPLQRVEGLIVPVLERIGVAWEEGRVSLSQVYMSGRLCEELVDAVLPPSDPSRKGLPPMAITVFEDYHVLGLRLVYSALRASGFALQNYGRTDLDRLVERVRADGIRILLVSVLMLPSALRVRDLKTRLDAEGCQTSLLVGGAPFRFDRELWHEVGADGVGVSAAEAVALVSKLAGVQP